MSASKHAILLHVDNFTVSNTMPDKLLYDKFLRGQLRRKHLGAAAKVI